MDTAAQWPQGIGVVKSMEAGSRPLTERRPRPQNEQALNCPRCHSTNTKFCYYNNYSLTQPRYFCKTCRRYWTEGGSLRNVPVGGGSRKNKRSSSTSSASSLKKFPHDHDHHLTTPNNFSQSSASQNPKIHQGQDLNLAYHPPITSTDHYNNHNPSSSSNSPHLSAMELLKSTGIVSRGLSSFIPMTVDADHQHHTNTIYSSSSGFPMEEFKPSTLSFSLDGIESSSGYNGSLHHQGVVQESSTSARLFFPFEGLKLQAPPNTDQFHHHEQNRGQGESTGYWSGMLGGGGSW